MFITSNLPANIGPVTLPRQLCTRLAVQLTYLMTNLIQKVQEKRSKSTDDTGKTYASAIARQFPSEPFEPFARYLPALLRLTALYGKGENDAPRRGRAAAAK
jgi:hypothetical protein